MTFDPIVPFSVVMLILFLSSIFLVWHESKNKHRFLRWRILSAILITLALAGIMLRPKSPSKKLNRIVLLTPGYSEKKVDSIANRHPQWSLAHLPDAKPYKNSELITEVDLPYRSQEVQVVVGQGIPRDQLDRMRKKAYEFIPGSMPEGIITLSIPERNFINRKNIISGTYNCLDAPAWLYLTGPAGREDSVEIKTNGNIHFELSFVPKLAGQFLYTLTTKGSEIAHEEVPVHIDSARSMNVVFLLSYPTFDVQYLKNFLGRKDYSTVLRYRVSRNNFRYEYINHDRVSFSRLTKPLLAGVDLLIVDPAALYTLSPPEMNNLQEAINAGLGLLNLSVVSHKKLKTFFPFETTPAKTDTVQLKIAGRSFSLPTSGVRVANSTSVTPVLKHHQGIIAGWTSRGAGKIGFQLLQETFRLTLRGDSLQYAEIWTPLLERVARSQPANSSIKIITPFPWYEEEPIDINAISTNENFFLLDDSVEIPIREDIMLDNIWYARTWGGNSGWHKLQTSDGSELHYYTFPTSAWKSLSLANQMRINALTPSGATYAQLEVESWEDIPPIIFYLAFICAAGFTWLAPKL
jgi:hypothetical protein